jgi:hypothetical protein
LETTNTQTTPPCGTSFCQPTSRDRQPADALSGRREDNL